MRALTFALVQADTVWHDPEANRARLDALLKPVSDADVVVLPEMFSTGFTMAPEQCHEHMEGDTLKWMRAQAQRLNAVVCGSLAMTDGPTGAKRFVNRFVWMRPDGSLVHYDKRHLFRMAGEHEHYAAGGERVIVEVAGWRICPLVCYDLRFPVWSRARNDYDVLLYVANWPSARQLAWEALLRARAIENLAYVVAVNRVGVDGKSLHYDGGSGAIAPTGESLSWQRGVAGVSTIRLDQKVLQDYRAAFPAWRDADEFSIR